MNFRLQSDKKVGNSQGDDTHKKILPFCHSTVPKSTQKRSQKRSQILNTKLQGGQNWTYIQRLTISRPVMGTVFCALSIEGGPRAQFATKIMFFNKKTVTSIQKMTMSYVYHSHTRKPNTQKEISLENVQLMQNLLQI